MVPVVCTHARHASAILAIFNDAIANSTALYDYHARTPENMISWFQAKAERNFPVIGIEDEHGQLLGFASYAGFRPHAAYKYTIEHSVYVQRDQRRKGVALALMTQLIELARQQDYHVMIGAIDADNRASIALHEALGFTYTGTIRQAGFKFGRWVDL
ncbi:MAG: GNAT family N-acetyltransferase, partial [Janthinobacterium lividum]